MGAVNGRGGQRQRAHHVACQARGSLRSPCTTPCLLHMRPRTGDAVRALVEAEALAVVLGVGEADLLGHAAAHILQQGRACTQRGGVGGRGRARWHACCHVMSATWRPENR
jgi:hypothetical protein